MNKKAIPRSVKLEELVLDVNNPRFAELYTGNNTEKELIEYLLYNEAAIEVAKAIVKSNEFYPDRPLWVIEKDGKYLVKDGNRRCAAVKALQLPGIYEIDLPKTDIVELPILLYKNETDVDERIFQEHANSLFRSWERIAKALEVYRLFKSGTTVNSMKDIDSSPSQLIKLGSFYYEAVKIGGDDFKKILTGGRKIGGRAIIFERLFSSKYTINCGYIFKNSPSYEIKIENQRRFESYISAMVNCLIDDTDHNITTDTIDKEEKRKEFFELLKSYGFDFYAKTHINTQSPNNTSASNSTTNNSSSSDSNNSNQYSNSSNNQINNGRTSIKKIPKYKRKGVPPGLRNLIDECYSLDANSYPNSKTALVRVAFENTMKYVLENTKHNSKSVISKSNYFQIAFKKKDGTPLPFSNFDEMKRLFTALIKETGKKKSFQNFDLDLPHQIIHNYDVIGNPISANNLCINLMPLIEFMLQDEIDLLNSLDLTKL